MVADAGVFDGPLDAELGQLRLVDHHAHGALRSDVSRLDFESMITEAPRSPSAGSQFDSQIGVAIRRWCAPVLGLPPHSKADAYWDRRVALGNAEATRRLLAATGTSHYLLDTGYRGDLVLGIDGHAEVSRADVREVVRLETVAENLLADTDSANSFLDAFPDRLHEATANAAAVKSIVAYRHGLGLPPERPSADDVRAGVERSLRAAGPRVRVTDLALLRYLLWCGLDRKLPIQLHTGYGDSDLDLQRANPILLTPWLRTVEHTGVPIMLLHCYPYHREAGYLAQVFDNVYFDIGLGTTYLGTQSRQLIGESLELAPFHKQLFSSDGWGPAELHLLGSVLWRRAASRVIGQWVDDGDWSVTDAIRVLHLIAHENAERVYQLRSS